MGQRANSGRHASLDEKKERMAGRRGRTGQSAPGAEAIRDAGSPVPMKGKTAGAHGRDDHPNRGAGGAISQGAGGGGGPTPPSE
jgi:hypothetical protein